MKLSSLILSSVFKKSSLLQRIISVKIYLLTKTQKNILHNTNYMYSNFKYEYR